MDIHGRLVAYLNEREKEDKPKLGFKHEISDGHNLYISTYGDEITT
jgi:hypothetical protein